MIFEIIKQEEGNAGESIYSWSIHRKSKIITEGKASTYKEAEEDIILYKEENGL